MGPETDRRWAATVGTLGGRRRVDRIPRRGRDRGGARDIANHARYGLAGDRLAVRHTDDDPPNSDCGVKSSN